MKLLSVLTAAAAVAIIFLLWRIDYLSDKWEEAKQSIKVQAAALIEKNEAIQSLNDDIDNLVELGKERDRRQAIYYENMIGALAQLEKKDKQLKRLANENESLRAWMDTPLPPDLIRVRERPAINGAAAYRKWLSEREALSVSGSDTQH